MTLKNLLPSFVLVGIYLLAATLTVQFFHGHGVISYLWLATGITLLGPLFYGYRTLPALLVGGVLGYLIVGQPFDAALSGGLRHAAIVGFVVWLVKRHGRFDPALSSLKNSKHRSMASQFRGESERTAGGAGNSRVSVGYCVTDAFCVNGKTPITAIIRKLQIVRGVADSRNVIFISGLPA